jgi:hypothetical protein
MFSILLPLFVFYHSIFADIPSMTATTDIVKSKQVFFRNGLITVGPRNFLI